jgi:predicted Rossmann fold nucleotide-binding protein DprA/Smf involved in DNA uptake
MVLTRGTVVVEAALRSGAINTARHAGELNRAVMAVPGPVIAEQSADCHELIRQCAATCVTGARDVIELVAPLGGPRQGRRVTRSFPQMASIPRPHRSSRSSAQDRTRARGDRDPRRSRPGHRAALPRLARRNWPRRALRPGLAR